MKKCMSGCGGKMMSKGGKVSPVKKMQKGGALKPLGAKIGVGTNIAGMIGMGVKAISDRVKAKKAEKKEKEAALDKKQKGGTIYKPNSIPNPLTPPKKPDYDIKDYINKRSPVSGDKEKGRGLFSKPKGGSRGLKLDKKQKGGVTKGNWSFNKDGSLKTFESERAKQPKQGGLLNKDEKYDKIRKDIEKTTGKKSSLKYQKGGIAKQEIVGMPGYNAKTNTMKSGGSTFGMLSVKAGVDKNPKPTAADRIVGAKKKAKFGASVPVQHSPAPGRVRSSSGVGTVPVGARKKMGGSTKTK